VRRHLPVWTYVIFGFAAIGLVTTMLFDMASLIRNILSTILMIAVIYGLVYFFVLRHRQPNDLKKYRKAVKQSKKKYQQPKKSSYQHAPKKQLKQKKQKKSKLSKHKHAPHLRVIDGKKDTHKKMTL
jgi:Sec-independent protein translocase protein TatA